MAANPTREQADEALTRFLATLALIGADLGLLGWTVHYVMNHAHALSLLGAALCVVSIFLAACCGCVVVRLLSRGG